MANTVNKNVIVPEVYAELVREKVAGKVMVAQACKILGDLKGKVGETLTMPKWAYIGDAKDIVLGTPMEATNMKQTSTTATIKMIAAPAISVNDYDDVVELGSALDEASKQQGTSIARKLDIDAITEGKKTVLQKQLATKNTVTFDEMNAILGLYGDDANASDFEFIAIHSAFIPSFLKMDGFVSAEVTFTAQGNGIQLNNLLGYFRGIPVVVSDRLYDNTNTEGFILVIKKDSIGLIPKESPFTEVARDASTRTNTIFTSQYYAMALIDDAGVVLAQTVLPTIA
jgi:hypothetical protein